MKGSQNVISRERFSAMFAQPHVEPWENQSADEFMNRAQETSSKNFQLVVSPPEDPYLRAKYDASPLGTINTEMMANVLLQMGGALIDSILTSSTPGVPLQHLVSASRVFVGLVRHNSALMPMLIGIGASIAQSSFALRIVGIKKKFFLMTYEYRMCHTFKLHVEKKEKTRHEKQMGQN